MVYKKSYSKVQQVQSSSCPEIVTGEAIVDRKSVFQAHCAIVHTVDDVEAVLSQLKSVRKIANAKHNVLAYRMENERGTVLQHSSDDGEAQAGGRLARLLILLQQRNVLVVVTRWFGGIEIGPDRFRHYNNAARQALLQAGLIVDRKKK